MLVARRRREKCVRHTTSCYFYGHDEGISDPVHLEGFGQALDPCTLTLVRALDYGWARIFSLPLYVVSMNRKSFQELCL